jgi:hypothetical protein
MSFDTLTAIVLVNVVITITLWLESRRRPPQPKLKRKFIKQLTDLHSKPITPKHQPPKTFDSGPPDRSWPRRREQRTLAAPGAIIGPSGASKLLREGLSNTGL